MGSNKTNNKHLSLYKKLKEDRSAVKIHEIIPQFRVISQQEW